MKIVVMGVSGCGKTSAAEKIAAHHSLRFLDADNFHNAANVDKMRTGIPLTDADRADWLASLNLQLRQHDKIALACSALKRQHRDQLRADNPDLVFLYLKGSMALIWQRMQSRSNHYFTDQGLLHNQFDTLEEPDFDEAMIVNIDTTLDEVVLQCLAQLKSSKEL
jgi:gluconokinase